MTDSPNNREQRVVRPGPRPLSEKERQQAEDSEWAATAPEVQQHRGKVVVVHQKRIVAVGTDRLALVDEAARKENCPRWELAVEIVPPLELWEIPH